MGPKIVKIHMFSYTRPHSNPVPTGPNGSQRVPTGPKMQRSCTLGGPKRLRKHGLRGLYKRQGKQPWPQNATLDGSQDNPRKVPTPQEHGPSWPLQATVQAALAPESHSRWVPSWSQGGPNAPKALPSWHLQATVQATLAPECHSRWVPSWPQGNPKGVQREAQRPESVTLVAFTSDRASSLGPGIPL